MILYMLKITCNFSITYFSHNKVCHHVGKKNSGREVKPLAISLPPSSVSRKHELIMDDINISGVNTKILPLLCDV